MNNTQLKRMRNISIIVIALHVIVLVFLLSHLISPLVIPPASVDTDVILEYFEYEPTSLWDIIKAYSVSIAFLPKWLSVISLVILLSIRIIDFIVMFYKFSLGVSKGEEEYREKKNKYKFIHILGILVTPAWFSMISFYGMNFGKAGEFYAYISSESHEIVNYNIVYPLINVFIVPAIVICVLLVFLDLSILIKPVNIIIPIFIMVLVFGAKFLPAECDSLIYGPNIKENLIRHNEKAITTYISSNDNYFFLGDVNYIYIDEIDIEATAETVRFDGNEVEFDYIFKDNKTNKEYVIEMKGERLWFGKYHWEIVSDDSVYPPAN